MRHRPGLCSAPATIHHRGLTVYMARRRDIGTDDPRVKVRPGKPRRPRTKKRPDYSDRPVGQVISVDRGRYHVHNDGTHLVAVKARALGRQGVIVGDRVRLTGDISGTKDTLARIVDILPRRTQLSRSPEDNEVTGTIKPIVANATQMAIVTASANPTPREGMVDRLLVAAYAGNLSPMIIMTKTDLADPAPFLAPYRALDIPCFTTAITDDGVDMPGLRAALANEETVMVGHSGVGKSTLMNALIPDAHRATGHVNTVTGKGRHTSSSLWAQQLPQGGWLIDTPGVRGFGLAHVDNDVILSAFDDLNQASVNCPKGCTHRGDGCALDSWASGDPHRRIRLDSFRRLIQPSDT